MPNDLDEFDIQEAIVGPDDEEFDIQDVERPFSVKGAAKKGLGFTKQLAKSAAAGALGHPGDIGRMVERLPTPLRSAVPRSVGGLGPLMGLMEMQSDLRERLGMPEDPLLELLRDKQEQISTVLPTAADLPTAPEFEEAFGEEDFPLAKRVGKAAGAGGLYGVGGGAIAAAKLAGRFAGAATAGEAVKRLTGSETAGIITEITAGMSPEIIRGLTAKKIPDEYMKKLVAKAEELGLDSEQTTALIRSPGAKRFLTKIMRRGKKAEKLGKPAREAIGKGYDAIKTPLESQMTLNPEVVDGMVDGIRGFIGELKTNVKLSESAEKVVSYLEGSIENLLREGATGKEVINWYQTLNETVNWKNMTNAEYYQAGIKDLIHDALAADNPKLAEDFRLVNDLYSRSVELTDLLKPTTFSTLTSMGQLGALAKGLLFLNPTTIKLVAASEAVRKGAQVALTSQRLLKVQKYLGQTQKNILKALAAGKGAAAGNMARKLAQRLAEDGVEFEIQEEEEGLPQEEPNSGT